LKKQTLGENTGVKKKKRKGPKRPNPLSCLKKKIKAEPVLPAKKKKRRKKKKSTENIET
jgi:U3 small nucleolar RNA-associated protein 23